jgi:hypothetical protein
MPQAVNLILILVLSVAPLFAVLRRAPWSPRTIKAVMVAVPLLLFPLNAPLHEALHIIGTWLMGGAVDHVRLLQRFWVPDAPVPMIETSGLRTSTARLVAAVLPYGADAALLAIGAVHLSRRRIRSPWAFGAFFLFLVVKPSFDIAANVAAASFFRIGDFQQVAGIIGGPGAAALQGMLLAGALGTTIAFVWVYRRPAQGGFQAGAGTASAPVDVSGS